VRLKARIVAEDPKEAGPRKQLNLGHTYAHAIEHLAGYGRIPHGIAVAAGVGAALEQAERCGVLEDRALPRRIRALSRALGLPASIAELEERYDLEFSEEALVASMRTDKKNRGGEIRFVLPRRAGNIAYDIPSVSELE
jgi:3-dehydroquinate synthetase